MPSAIPALVIDPVSRIASNSRILPGPIARSSPRSTRKVSRAAAKVVAPCCHSRTSVLIGPVLVKFVKSTVVSRSKTHEDVDAISYNILRLGDSIRKRDEPVTTLETSKHGLKVVGTRPIRPDGVEKVTGRANFGADRALPGMLHGRIKRSPHAHARIVKISTDKALALPGVRAVATAADFSIADLAADTVRQDGWKPLEHRTQNQTDADAERIGFLIELHCVLETGVAPLQ